MLVMKTFLIYYVYSSLCDVMFLAGDQGGKVDMGSGGPESYIIIMLIYGL